MKHLLKHLVMVLLCAMVSQPSTWMFVDSHTIILNAPGGKVLVKIPYCYLSRMSSIIVIKDYMCAYDKIIVDGEACDVTKVERL